MVLIPFHPAPRRLNQMTATMIKRPRSISLSLPLTGALVLAVLPVGQAEPPPQKIDVTTLRTQINDVVIPNPSEVFSALDKMGSPNWHNVLSAVPSARKIKPPEIAMLLGSVIANGFIAVEAKDGEAVQNTGRKVIELADALGVRKEVQAHSQAITTAAKEDNWNVVRVELDKAKSSVTGGMERLHSQDESELVSIAGWLRGTQALTALIMADYKPERAELLHQPDILATFERQFDSMGDKAKENKSVKELREGLKKVKAIILSGGNEPLPLKSVEEINAICSDLVKSLEH